MLAEQIDPTDPPKKKFVYSETINLDEPDRANSEHPGFSTENDPASNKNYNYPEEDRIDWEGAGFGDY